MKRLQTIKKLKRHVIAFSTMVILGVFMLGMTAMAAGTRQVSLSSGKTYIGNEADYNTSVYHKITIPRNGYIKVTGWGRSAYSVNRYSMGVLLCNSKKKPMEDYKTYLSSYSKPGFTGYYGVRKGTYYLKVEGEKLYNLSYSFSSVKEKSGSSQRKAVAIKRNKTVNGVLPAGENGSKTDWYKINLKNKQKITLWYGAKANDYINFRIAAADKNVFITGSSAIVKSGTNKYVTRDKFPKGTYYIKVTRSSNLKSTSGAYSIKWK